MFWKVYLYIFSPQQITISSSNFIYFTYLDFLVHDNPILLSHCLSLSPSVHYQFPKFHWCPIPCNLQTPLYTIYFIIFLGVWVFDASLEIWQISMSVPIQITWHANHRHSLFTFFKYLFKFYWIPPGALDKLVVSNNKSMIQLLVSCGSPPNCETPIFIISIKKLYNLITT